jgi:hypothetical protein
LANGAGGVDCVCDAALYELRHASDEIAPQEGGAWTTANTSLLSMVESRRLRDITDVALDLLLLRDRAAL